ncbi:TetR/AcrR family transcriptional regulator [Glaciibacter flavus]|uniref:TetR/AcrR family transcriptional regulator n=1 Tax=Orlajensenia flava TaxID=2565934 RepID=UPI003AFFCDDB
MDSIVATNPILRMHVVDVAERLYNARGFQAVSMDELRAEAGVSLKKLYALFPSKDAIIVAVLETRHAEWVEGVTDAVAAAADPRAKMLAVYDWLSTWFCEDDFRGCAFINAFAELGGMSPALADIAREHKLDFQTYVATLVSAADGPDYLAPQLAILAEGAQTTAAIAGTPEAADQARAAASVLIDAALAA